MASTYSELISEIADEMIRTDMDDRIPRFIARAEKRFNRVLRVPEMEEVSSATFVDATITLPTDFLELKSLYLTSDPTAVLEQMDHDVLKRTYQYGETGVPRYFALQSGNELIFGPAPDGEYTAVLNYYAMIPALSDSNTSNWLLSAHDDVYLAGSLFEGFKFVRDQQETKVQDAILGARLAEIMKAGADKASSRAPQRLSADLAPWSGAARSSFWTA